MSVEGIVGPLPVGTWYQTEFQVAHRVMLNTVFEVVAHTDAETFRYRAHRPGYVSEQDRKGHWANVRRYPVPAPDPEDPNVG